MKKITSFVLIGGMLAFLSGLAIAGNPNIRSKPALTNTFFTSSVDQMQLELKGCQVVTATHWVLFLDNIAGYNQANFYVTAVGSGTITTASLQPVYANEVLLGASHDAVLTSGTDLTNFKSQFYKMTIYNWTGAPCKLTANILITR